MKRKIKISSLFSRRIGKSKYVPFIRLSGLWLQNAGFKIGGNIQVEVRNNQLIITNLEV